MSKKKTILSILAIILICVISVTGTLAILKATTKETPVVNTFVAAGGGSLFTDASGALVLDESQAVKGEDSTYTLDTSKRVTTNSYEILPGTTVPKDPTVQVTGKNAIPAYLFVEIVDATNANLTWTAADGWSEVSGVTAPHGGSIYVWNTTLADTANTEGGATYSISVLKDNKITVADVEDLALGEEGQTITFYAYLAQAVIGDSVAEAATVFNTAAF